MYCVVSGKQRKFKSFKMLYIFEKLLVSFIIFSKGGSSDEKIFKEEKSIEILKTICSINDIEEYQKIIAEENATQEIM